MRIAVAPGIACFEANKEYEHGGVSPQECVVPRLTVPRRGTAVTDGRRGDHEAEVARAACAGSSSQNVAAGATVDIRALPADPSTSIAEQAKETSERGQGSRCSSRTRTSRASGAHLVLVSPRRAASSPSARSWSGGTDDASSTSSTGSPPTSSRATSSRRTSPSSSAASTRSRPTSASSCSAATAPRPIRTRSPRASRSSSGR